jgi:membrane-associated protease RseP (regulator of RpoE activity)
LNDYDQTPRDRYWLHIILFMMTVVTTMMAGMEFITAKSWAIWFQYQYLTRIEGMTVPPPPAHIMPNAFDFLKGWSYSFCFLLFLTFHEFGHYFTAVYHRVRCSLPYYIPIFIPFSALNIGSMGAVIRLRQQPDTTTKFFDIGIAGPLAGFVISIILLTVGFATLPPPEEKIFALHPEYQRIWGYVPSEAELLAKFGNPKYPQLMYVGHSLLFDGLAMLIADPARLPHHFELMHYPMLFVGFITLFFTALNLLPIGQLDGGHIIYGLFGRRVAGLISRITVVVLVTIGGVGLFSFPTMNWEHEGIFLLVYLIYLFTVIIKVTGSERKAQAVVLIILVLLVQQMVQMIGNIDRAYNLVWLLYGLIATRLIGLDHPPALREESLDFKRKLLGWFGIVIFILCFSPAPVKFL